MEGNVGVRIGGGRGGGAGLLCVCQGAAVEARNKRLHSGCVCHVDQCKATLFAITLLAAPRVGHVQEAVAACVWSGCG